MEKPHLSPSQIEMFCRCPVQWRFRYLDKIVVPPGMAAMKGKGLHVGAAHNMRQKVESHQDLPAREIIAAAVEGFDAGLRDGYSLTDQEEECRDATVAAARDDVVTMALVHADLQAPDYQPVMVEKAVEVEIGGPFTLLGIIDLIDDQARVIDFKTSGKRKSQGDLDGSLQLTAYSVLHNALFGKLPSEVRLDILVEGQKGVGRQVLTGTRQPNDLVALQNRIQAIERSIAAGVFVPCSSGSWCCSPRWCGYFKICPYVNSKPTLTTEV